MLLLSIYEGVVKKVNLLLQVWDVKFNAEGNKLLSVGKDKTLNIYECPVPVKQK